MTNVVRRQPDVSPDGEMPRRDTFEPTGSPFWWARIPVLAWGAWAWIHHLRDEQYQGVIKGLNLALHEMGHVIFGGLGEFVGSAAFLVFLAWGSLEVWRLRKFQRMV